MAGGRKLYKQNFNSPAHVERDGREFVAKLSSQNFNSHAHVERDKGVGWKAK